MHIQRSSSTALVAISILIVLASCSDDSTSPPDEPLVAGDITTWAGTGQAGFDGDGHSRAETEFYWPQDIEFTPHLGVFVTDWSNHRIRRYESNKTFHTVIGRDSDGDGPDSPAGGEMIGRAGRANPHRRAGPRKCAPRSRSSPGSTSCSPIAMGWCPAAWISTA